MANPMKGLAQFLTSAGPDYGSALPGMQGGQEMANAGGGQPLLPKPMISSPLHGPYAPGLSDMAGTDGAKPNKMGDSPPHPMAQLGKYLQATNAQHFLRGLGA